MVSNVFLQVIPERAYQVIRGNSLPPNSKVAFVLWKSILNTITDEVFPSEVEQLWWEAQKSTANSVDVDRKSGSIYGFPIFSSPHPHGHLSAVKLCSIPEQTCGGPIQWTLAGVLALQRRPKSFQTTTKNS
jgi:hypothetical protein